MRKGLRKKAAAVLMAVAVLLTAVNVDIVSYAKGPTYTAIQDVYYTKENCVVYAEPTYTCLLYTSPSPRD